MRKLSFLLGLGVTVLGAIVLVGWAQELDALKSILPGLVTMKANTAFCLAIGGLALVFLTRKPLGKSARAGIVGIGAVILAVGAVTLAQYLGGWNFHIDEMFFRDVFPNQTSTSSPGRMAPISALSFVFLGMAFGIAARPSSVRWRLPLIAALSAAVGMIGGVAFFGCLLKLATGYMWWDYTGLAVHTAAGFMMLGVGMLVWIKNEEDVVWSLGAKATGGFVIAVAMMVTMAGVSFGFTNKLRESDKWVSHTHEVLTKIQEVSTDALELQSQQRGYFITGDLKLLKRYGNAKVKLSRDIHLVRVLTDDNPTQQQRINQLESLVARRIDWSDQNIAAYQQNGFLAAQKRILIGTGVALSDQIQALLREMENEEHRLLQEREIQSGPLATTTFLLLPLGVFFSLSLLFLGVSLLNADVAARQKAEAEHRKLAQLIEHSRDFIAMADLDGQITFMNSGARRMIGVPDDRDVNTLHFSDYVAPEWQPFFREKVIPTAYDVGLWEGELQLRHLQTGAPIDVFRSTFLLRDAKGRPHSFATVTRDITEGKRTAERSVWLATFPERNPNPIIELDLASGLFQYLNSAATRQFPDLASEGLRHPLVAGLVEIAEELAEKGMLRREITVGEHFFSQMVTYLADARRVRIYCTDITELRNAEVALREKEAQFHVADRRLAEIVQGMTEACFALDTDWRFTFVNDRTETLLRRRREEMLSRSIWEIFPTLAGTPMENNYRRAMSEREPAAYEVFSPTAERWLDIRLFPTAEGLAAFLLDIDDRIKAEAAIRTSEERLQAVTENLSEGLIISDVEGGLLRWNRAGLEICGYSNLEEGMRNLPEFTDTFEHAAFEGEVLPLEKWPLSRVLRGETLRNVEIRLRRHDRDWTRILSYSGALVHDSSGQALAFLAISDITARKQAEAAVRASELHFRFLDDVSEATRNLADPAQIMAAMVRMLGKYLSASRCAYADVEPDGERFTILHDYTDGCASTVGNYRLSLFGARAANTLCHGQTLILRDVQAEISSGEGAEMFNSIGIQAIIVCPLVKNGVLRAMMAVHQTSSRDWLPSEIAMVQDVVERCWATIERRTAEEKVLLLNAELEIRVTERTTQLEEANKELEAFSYSVSHDLRAPLRAVDGFSQAVLEDYGPLLPTEGLRYLETIRGGAQKMGLLIDDLLTFSRLSRAPLQKQTVNTEKMVLDVLQDLSFLRQRRQIDLSMGNLPNCTGDPALLKQVWINLLSNALKYTQKRETTVLEIGCQSQPEGEFFFVRDNGTGFDMRYADKLFGVFQRLHREEDYEGTGVGLAIVQRIIHRHGGRIWAEAAEDRGATFYFTLEEPNKL